MSITPSERFNSPGVITREFANPKNAHRLAAKPKSTPSIIIPKVTVAIVTPTQVTPPTPPSPPLEPLAPNLHVYPPYSEIFEGDTYIVGSFSPIPLPIVVANMADSNVTITNVTVVGSDVTITPNVSFPYVLEISIPTFLFSMNFVIGSFAFTDTVNIEYSGFSDSPFSFQVNYPGP